MSSLTHAPWTSEQVHALNHCQRASYIHPFTCGAEHHVQRPVLEATHAGWICPDPACEYTQDWAHEFMLRPKAIQAPFAQLLALTEQSASVPSEEADSSAGPTLCTFGVTEVPGSGCLLLAGHKPANRHLVTEGDADMFED